MEGSQAKLLNQPEQEKAKPKRIVAVQEGVAMETVAAKTKTSRALGTQADRTYATRSTLGHGLSKRWRLAKLSRFGDPSQGSGSQLKCL